MVIVLSKTHIIEDVPRMVCKGRCTITCNDITVLEIMHTNISKRVESGRIFFNGHCMYVPIYVHCVSDDGIECLMIVGKENNKYVRYIIPLC